MNIQQWTTCLFSAVLLTACGGSSDNNNDTSLSTDGNASYTGLRTLAALNTSNTPDFLNILYSSGLETPSLSFRSTQGITLAKNDFLREQEKMLQRLKQQVTPIQFMQRSVTETEACDNADGNVVITGTLEDGSSKGKADLEYNNCRYGNLVIDGKASMLIYATNGTFQEISSVSVTYQGIQATPTDGGEAFRMTGTVDEVVDYNTNSTRVTTQLHRQTVNTGTQVLVDTVRQYFAADGAVRINGSIYNGSYGQAKISTLQPVIYNANDTPIAGEILMKGAADSKVKVTALGEQYSLELDEYLIMLQIQVDANGDGAYENTTQVDSNDL